MNSSKLTHSLWLISLCLSWILLPVFEALQWADDCLGRDYYTNLSTLLCQALSPGRLCVFLGFITISLHKRKCLCACSSMSMHLCIYVDMCPQYICSCTCVCVSSITVIFPSHGRLFFPVAVTVSGLLPTFITDTALHADNIQTPIVYACERARVFVCVLINSSFPHSSQDRAKRPM